MSSSDGVATFRVKSGLAQMLKGASSGARAQVCSEDTHTRKGHGHPTTERALSSAAWVDPARARAPSPHPPRSPLPPFPVILAGGVIMGACLDSRARRAQ
jgi:hypothetical protein